MKIHLHNEMETLLIPLYGKASMSREGLFADPFAEAAIDRIDYDFGRLRIQRKTQVMLALRAALIDDFARGFIAEHPGCPVLHLGCGLDARYGRLTRQGIAPGKWYDVDYPQVIAIKRQLYGETEDYRYLGASVTETGWLEEVAAAGPVLVVAEGLLMYLTQGEIKALWQALYAKLGGYTIIFDAFSMLAADGAKHHPSLRRTGAIVKWGVDSPEELEGYVSEAKHRQTIYLTEAKALELLPPGYRMLFRLVGRVRSAREAQRIFVLEVGQ